jgi:hypothetical protein
MKKKINIPFSDFCSAGSWLQFVTTDSQTSDHNFSFRFLSLYPFNFFIQRWPSLHFPYWLFYVFHNRRSLWRKTQGLCTLLQLASNYLVASARGQTWTCAFHLYQQQFCCLENRSGCNFFKLRQQKSCQCARSHIKQCSPSRQQKSWATKVASARLA